MSGPFQVQVPSSLHLPVHLVLFLVVCQLSTPTDCRSLTQTSGLEPATIPQVPAPSGAPAPPSSGNTWSQTSASQTVSGVLVSAGAVTALLLTFYFGYGMFLKHQATLAHARYVEQQQARGQSASGQDDGFADAKEPVVVVMPGEAPVYAIAVGPLNTDQPATASDTQTGARQQPRQGVGKPLWFELPEIISEGRDTPHPEPT